MKHHRLLLLTLSLSLMACGPKPGRSSSDASGWGPISGLSEPAKPRLSSQDEAPVKSAPRKPWRHAAMLAKLRRVGGRGVSDHLAGKTERTVWVNELARSYSVVGSERKLPPGSLIVQRHHEPEGTPTIATFIMQKGAPGSAPNQGDWAYVVLDQAEQVVAQGRLTRCHRCHAEARHDHLFGPPASP